MPEELFDIHFSGQLLEGQDPAVAREQVGQLFKASDTQLARLFSGQPVVVKKGVDLDTATRYRLAFRKAGALVRIQPSAAAQVPTPEAPWTLAAPHSGSLEGYAIRPEPAPLPDISGLRLSGPGALLDERLPLPEISIETEEFSLVPGQDWSLEDCQPEVVPAPLPNIESMRLDQPGVVLDTAPPPPAEPLPDISGLRLLDPESPTKRQ